MTTATEIEATKAARDDDEEKTSAFAQELTFYYEEAKNLYEVLTRTLMYCARGKWERHAVVEQCFAIGNQSLFFMSVTMGFIGAIIVYQICTQTMRVVPDLSMMGPMYLKILIREIGPSVGALPLATRVGAGIAAQIGSMVVTEQTDALRMSAADPVEYLIVPRFIASCLMGTVILLIGCAIAFGVGSVVAWAQFHVNPHNYFKFNGITWGDGMLCLIKCLTFGGAMAIVSGQRGLRTFGGSEGVGKATTEAVVGSLFVIILLDLILSIIGYWVFPA
jgi:phospholipid/cholesterol/gamma-HCH transport system permease protein